MLTLSDMQIIEESLLSGDVEVPAHLRSVEEVDEFLMSQLGEVKNVNAQ